MKVDIVEFVNMFVQDPMVEFYNLLSLEDHVVRINSLFWCNGLITSLANTDTHTISDDNERGIVLRFFWYFRANARLGKHNLIGTVYRNFIIQY